MPSKLEEEINRDSEEIMSVFMTRGRFDTIQVLNDRTANSIYQNVISQKGLTHLLWFRIVEGSNDEIRVEIRFCEAAKFKSYRDENNPDIALAPEYFKISYKSGQFKLKQWAEVILEEIKQFQNNYDKKDPDTHTFKKSPVYVKVDSDDDALQKKLDRRDVRKKLGSKLKQDPDIKKIAYNAYIEEREADFEKIIMYDFRPMPSNGEKMKLRLQWITDTEDEKLCEEILCTMDDLSQQNFTSEHAKKVALKLTTFIP